MRYYPQISNGGLPQVFFDRIFIDFFKDNYSRFLRAIDRDPKFEVSIVSNGIQKGVSRELVDGLRAQIEEQKQSLEAANGELLQFKRRLEQEELDHRRTRESGTVELSRIKQINQSLHDNHEDETIKLQQAATQERSALVRAHEDETNRRRNEHMATIETARKQHEAEMQRFDQRLKLIEQEAARERTALTEQHKRAMDEAAARAQNAREREAAEIADLQRRVSELDAQLKKTDANHVQDLEAAHEEYNTTTGSLEARLERADARAADAETHSKTLADQLEREKAGRNDVQTELDDLLVVFADLEAKRSGDKKKLKELGQEVSEDEDEDGAEDNDEGEDDDEGDVD